MGLGVASAGADADAPILALLPFDGPADPGSKPDRVVLLVKDHERLELLARRDDPQVVTGTSLVSASHKVNRDAPGMALVESTYEVEVDGPGPAFWTLPIGPAQELFAEVDDRPSPLAISPDGLSATLNLEGAGVHRLRFRRLVKLSAIGRDGERARVPINRAAFARVAVTKGAGPSWVEVVGASGKSRRPARRGSKGDSVRWTRWKSAGSRRIARRVPASRVRSRRLSSGTLGQWAT